MSSKTNFIFVHGAYGNPSENWFPWLTYNLRERGFDVSIPIFPTPDGQELNKWLRVFDEQVPVLNKDTVLVGHSIAVAFILRKLERIELQIKAAFLVSGFSEQLGLAEFDPINASFVEGEFNWDKIRKNCQKFFVYNSDNDPYVPTKYGKAIADKTDAKFTVVKNGGHINLSAGFNKFEQLLDDINTII